MARTSKILKRKPRARKGSIYKKRKMSKGRYTRVKPAAPYAKTGLRNENINEFEGVTKIIPYAKPMSINHRELKYHTE